MEVEYMEKCRVMPRMKVWAIICDCGINPFTVILWDRYLNVEKPETLRWLSDFIYFSTLRAEPSKRWSPCFVCSKVAKFDKVWFEQVFSAAEEWSKVEPAVRSHYEELFTDGECMPPRFSQVQVEEILK